MCFRWFAAKGIQMTVSSHNATCVFMTIHLDRQCALRNRLFCIVSGKKVMSTQRLVAGLAKRRTAMRTCSSQSLQAHLLGFGTAYRFGALPLNFVSVPVSVVLDAQSTPPNAGETRVSRAIHVLERGSVRGFERLLMRAAWTSAVAPASNRTGL